MQEKLGKLRQGEKVILLMNHVIDIAASEGIKG
jgi:hypothetical protein